MKQVYTLMWGQCSERLRDKLETNPRFTIVSATKDVIALNDMVCVHAHETMDTRRKRAWTAINMKATILNYHQEQCKLNDMDYYCERVQGLKTGF
mmetsp:Transcript_17391/g.36470  ORF Transcript_17391/g.36470 Transcript_17391/m.36470 type:complete len:95 (+) Transcript_17391:421-705(+)